MPSPSRPSFAATMAQWSAINQRQSQQRSANFARLRAFVADADALSFEPPPDPTPTPDQTGSMDRSPAREPTLREQLDELRRSIPRRSSQGGQPAAAVALGMVESAARRAGRG